MSFGDIIRQATLPSTFQHRGTGGDANTIWHCYKYGSAPTPSSRVCELATSDLSLIRWATAPSINPYGIGGDANTIWYCDQSSRKVYELSTVDFSVIRSISSPAGQWDEFGIGGDANTIWYTEDGNDKVYELSTTDFSIIRSSSSPSTFPSAIGGDANTIWHGDSNTHSIYELSTTDFSVIRTRSPLYWIFGIGGDANTIWANKSHPYVYELDATSITIQVGDIVLLIPNYCDIYDRAAIKGSDISTGDNVQLYPLKGGAKVAIKDEWATGDKIIF